MASGYRSGGADFDDLFDPYVEGEKSITTGRRVAGVDLNQRYAHINYGSKRADVGMRVGGVDVANLWAAKGTASYGLPFHGKSFSQTANARTGFTGTASATVTLLMFSDGTYAIRRSSVTAGSGNTDVVADSGRWLREGESAANYEARITGTSSGSASFSGGTSSFATMSVSRSAATSVSVPAESSSSASGATLFSVELRKVGGSASLSTFNGSVSATGWQ